MWITFEIMFRKSTECGYSLTTHSGIYLERIQFLHAAGISILIK